MVLWVEWVLYCFWDTFEIYEEKIWMLYKDVCGENLVNTLGVLRACQLGIISQAELKHAIESYGDGIDVEDLLIKVRAELQNFGPEGV